MKQEMMGWQWHQLSHMQIVCILLQTDNHASTSSLRCWRGFYRPDALPDAQPRVSKQWRLTHVNVEDCYCSGCVCMCVLVVIGHRCIVRHRVTTLKLCSCWLSMALASWHSRGIPSVKLRSTNAVLRARDLTSLVSSLKVLAVQCHLTWYSLPLDGSAMPKVGLWVEINRTALTRWEAIRQ